MLKYIAQRIGSTDLRADINLSSQGEYRSDTPWLREMNSPTKRLPAWRVDICHTGLGWNTSYKSTKIALKAKIKCNHIDFSSFAAFKRTVQHIDLSMFFILLLGLCLFWVIIRVTRDLIIQFTRVYWIVSIHMHVSVCENKWWWWWWRWKSNHFWGSS